LVVWCVCFYLCSRLTFSLVHLFLFWVVFFFLLLSSFFFLQFLQGFNLFATRGTAKVLQEEGDIQNITVLNKPSESKSGSSSSSSTSAIGDAVDYIQTDKIDLVINITDAFRQQNVSDGYQIRRATVDFGVSLISNLRCAELFVKSLHNVRNGVTAAPSAPGGMSSPRSKEHKQQAEAADVGDPHFPPRHILEYYRTNAFAMDDYA